MKSKRLTILTLLASLLAASCGDMEDLVNSLNRDSTVVYGEGGLMFVLVNHCLQAYPDTNSDGYKNCTLPQGAPWFGPEDTTTGGPASPDARVEVMQFAQDEVEQVIPWAHRFKWITVNPSMCSTRCAVVMASIQMKVMQAEGVVLVYLPQGPDRSEIMDPDEPDPTYMPSYETRENAANRYLCGRFANEHPIFFDNMTTLVEQVTNPSNSQGAATGIGTQIVVSAYSYSVALTMETLRDNSDVIFLAVAPSFGWQAWSGSPSHNAPDWGDNCVPDWASRSYHELARPNPHLEVWHNNLATHTAPTCMYTSYGDCLSQNFAGSAMANPPGGATCNDRMEINEHATYGHAEAISGFGIPFLPSPPHDPGPSVFDPDHPGGWRDINAWTLGAPGQLIGDYWVGRAISANWQSVDSLRMFAVETTSAAQDRSYEQSWTRQYSEENPVGHFGYWQNGNLPPLPGTTLPPEQPPAIVPPEHYTANFNFKDNICDCPSQFAPVDCPACDDLTALCDGSISQNDFEWMLDSDDQTVDQRLGIDVSIKDNDVVWYPTSFDLPVDGIETAFSALRSAWGNTVATESGRFTRLANRAAFRMNLVPPPSGRLVQKMSITGGVGIGQGTCDGDPLVTTYRQSASQTSGMLTAHPYYDLVGHWIDVDLNWWDSHDLSICDDETQAHGSGPHRVLFMKMAGLGPAPQQSDYESAFIEPVPDVRNMVAPETVCVNEGDITIQAQAYTHAATAMPFTDEMWGEFVFGSLTEGHYDPALNDSQCVDGDCNKGRTYDYTFTVDPLDIWCRLRATTDTLCGGTGTGTPAGVHFRFWATNQSGNSFWRTVSMGLERCD